MKTMKLFGGQTDAPESGPPEDSKSSLFSRMKQAVSRTRESLSAKIEDLVALTRTVDESTLEGLEAALLSSDLGVQTTTEILAALRDRARRQAIEGGDELRALLKQQLRAILEASISNQPNAIPPAGDPAVIFLVGVNGTGKTTTIGKLANRLHQQGQKVILAAGDTFRAAATEQLSVWAKRTHSELIHQKPGADPAAVVFDALSAARARHADAVIVDTAGRLHTKSNLMAELEKMRRTAAKIIPGAPHDVLLVMDATTGQNGLTQAREFTATAGVTGIVLTKLDGTAKGGIVVAIVRELGLPVRFVGTGESADDLVPFDAETFVNSLFD